MEPPRFHRYHEVFDKFGFGICERAWILVRVFSFSKFVKDGKAIVSYTRSNDPKKKGKKTKKPRSKRQFERALGIGRIEPSRGSSAFLPSPSSKAAPTRDR